MNERTTSSPLDMWRHYLVRGKLAYQYDESSRKAVFYPRLIAPCTGSTQLSWKVSEGLGTVYAATVLFPRGEPSYNVVLIDMDEGFRLMSRVESIPSEEVSIGMRVRVHIHNPDGDEAPYPVFIPVEAA